MPKKGYTPEQIINKLREAEILTGQGNAIVVIAKKIGWQTRDGTPNNR